VRANVRRVAYTAVSMSVLPSVTAAIDALRAGRMVIVVDDAHRENEGDIVMAAECMTEEAMAFIIRHTGGVVCLALSEDIADQLELPLMVEENSSRFGTPFTVSIEAADRVTTGISAADRATTVRAATSPVAKPSDLRRPGHIFPLRARRGGVLRRAGHTEASVDLCRLAGMRESAVISELMHDDGTMMRMPDLRTFGEKNNIPLVAIADIIAYRQRTETFIRREAETTLETETGVWRCLVYRDTLDGYEHMALVQGSVTPTVPVLTRVHSECLTGDALGSLHCDCGLQLRAAMQRIQKEGRGVLLYMRQEGRGIGLANKIKAYELQDRGRDTVEANTELGFPEDMREYGIGAQILKDIGVGAIRLLTNNPRKVIGLEGYGLHIIERVPLFCTPVSQKQKTYLRTKRTKLGHLLPEIPGEGFQAQEVRFAKCNEN